MCWLVFGVRFTPRVTAVARTRPRSFCQKCRWQVTPKHAYSVDPTKSEWADYTTVLAWCGNLLGKRLTRNSSRKAQPQPSQLGEPLWTDPGVKSGISVRKLISTKKKKKFGWWRYKVRLFILSWSVLSPSPSFEYIIELLNTCHIIYCTTLLFYFLKAFDICLITTLEWLHFFS